MIDFTFIHVPRTAGTSLRIFLDLGRKGSHITALQARERDGEEAWNAAFTFAFVRNPWDKVVSWFLHGRKRGFPEYRGSFTHWVERECPHHWEAKRLWDRRLWYEPRESASPINSLPFITDLDGKVIVDHVAMFENLLNEVACIGCIVGCEKDLERFAHHHKTRHALDGYRSYYRPHTREIVAVTFQEEIERFNYEF